MIRARHSRTPVILAFKKLEQKTRKFKTSLVRPCFVPMPYKNNLCFIPIKYMATNKFEKLLWFSKLKS